LSPLTWFPALHSTLVPQCGGSNFLLMTTFLWDS
jgi:hypothetical protein